jgi:hypothetical protein
MPYISLIDHVQVRTNHAIEPVVHLSKTVKLHTLENNISNASNNPIRLIRWACCATNVNDLNNYKCFFRLRETICCCLQVRQTLSPVHFSKTSSWNWAQNVSTLNKTSRVSKQFKPKVKVHAVVHKTLIPPRTTSFSSVSNHNHVVITKENQFNAWKVLLEEYEVFPFDKQINIYNHIVGHLTELTLPAREQLVVLLEQLIIKKDYECPTSHRMEEMYMAAYKSLEKKV